MVPLMPAENGFFSPPQLDQTTEIAPGHTARIEFNSNEDLHLYGATNQWGLRISTALIRDSLAHINPNLSDQGFPYIYSYAPEVNMENRVKMETEATVNLIRQTAEFSGVSLDKIACVSFASGVPPHAQFGREVVYEAGIPNDRPVLQTFAACDSGALAHERLCNMIDAHPSLQDEWVAVVAHEGLRRYIPDIDDTSVADPFSLSIFSDLSSILLYQPRTMRRIVSKTVQKPDLDGHLAAFMSYPIDGSFEPSTLVETDGGSTVSLVMPPIDEPLKIHLNQRGTVVGLGFAGGEALKDTIHEHDILVADSSSGFTNNPISVVFCHMPSQKMVEFIRKKAELNEGQMPFSGKYGNSSSATVIGIMKDAIPKLKPGQHIVQVAYGAGWLVTANAFELGLPR